ncbi:hypothetical protein TUM20985_21520 [Mycobacterium antarcticum]|nr:hypothetical protein TUM20985_21520 [Mycolicibacterium sp. TUM20985]
MRIAAAEVGLNLQTKVRIEPALRPSLGRIANVLVHPGVASLALELRNRRELQLKPIQQSAANDSPLFERAGPALPGAKCIAHEFEPSASSR